MFLRAFNGIDLGRAGPHPRKEVDDGERHDSRPGSDVQDTHVGLCEPLIDDLPEDMLKLHQVYGRVVGEVAEDLVGLPVAHLLSFPVPALLDEDGVPHPVEDDWVVPCLGGLPLDVVLHESLDVIGDLRVPEERELPLAPGITDQIVIARKGLLFYNSIPLAHGVPASYRMVNTGSGGAIVYHFTLT